MFVSSLNLKEFRGIKSFKKPLELAKFNVLVGRNNSGKSTILQALSILPHPHAGLPMGLDISGALNRKDLLEHFLGKKESVIYRYIGSASLEFKIKGKTWRVQINKGWNSFIENENIDIGGCCKYLGISIEKARDYVTYVPNDSTFLRSLEKKLWEEWASVEKSEAFASVIEEVINKSIDEVFTEVIPRFEELYVRKEKNGKPFYYVRVRDLGSGIEKILSVLLWLETCSPKLVLWDDFEASVHPTLIKFVLEWLSKKKWQVVLATHSIDVLIRLLEVELESEDCGVILLKKTKDDVLLHKKLTKEALDDFDKCNGLS
ncbi:MAG: AAA family ATPase [Candidatus Methanospirareceae archaeon]